MAYYRTVNGPTILYSSPGNSWWSGQYEWVRTSSSSVEKRKKPVGSDLLVQQTAYSVSRRLSSTARYTFDDYSGYYIRNCAPAPTVAPAFPNEEYQSARNGVVTKLRLKIKDEEWNLSTFVGELPETMKYFGKTLTDVVRLYRAVKRGDVRQVRKVRDSYRKARGPGHRSFQYADRMKERWLREANSGTNKVAERWMEWRYAISPMMYDLDDMFKVLYSKRNVPIYRRKVTGTTIRWTDKRVCEVLGTQNQYETLEASMVLRLGLIYRVDSQVDGFKRLGLLNPLATLWELHPLSFVYDWFIPIGDYLSSLDAMAGVQAVSAWESQRVKSTATRSDVVSARYGENWSISRINGSFASLDSYSRSVGISLQPSFPAFGLSLTAKRLLDAASLAKLLLLK